MKKRQIEKFTSDANPQTDEPVIPFNDTHTALGTYLNPTDNQWYIAEVKYDPSTGKTSEVNAIAVGPERALAEERFKIMVVQTNIF